MPMENPPKAYAYRVPIGDYNYLQCVVHLKGKHCRKPQWRNGVVDTFVPGCTPQTRSGTTTCLSKLGEITKKNVQSTSVPASLGACKRKNISRSLD